MEIWDLNRRPLSHEAKKYIEEKGRDKNKHPRFCVGQVISFWTGYNDDIRAKAKILGFDDDGGIYVYQDCYWFPIKDNDAYKISEEVF